MAIQSSKKERLILKEQLEERNLVTELRSLRKSDFLLSLKYFLTDFCVIVLCLGGVINGPLWATPFLIFILSTRIRGIGNLLHDSFHGNFCPNREINNFFGRLILAPFSFENFKCYSSSHTKHHSKLGELEDPDLLNVDRTDDQSLKRLMKEYFTLLVNRQFWIGSLLGDLPKINLAKKLEFLLCWIGLSSFIASLFGWEVALKVCVIIMVTRGTLYHFLRVFWELADHGFLNPDTEIMYTRNMPSKGFLRHLLHPHNDSYHLTHHLYPGIPMCNLAKAHSILMHAPIYAEAEHCGSYFIGPNSLISKWT